MNSNTLRIPRRIRRILALERCMERQQHTMDESNPDDMEVMERFDDAVIEILDTLNEHQQIQLVHYRRLDEYSNQRRYHKEARQSLCNSLVHHAKCKKAATLIENHFLNALYNPRTPLGYRKVMSLYDENF